MKKIITLIITTFIFGCISIKKIDTVGFHVIDNTIFYDKDTVATLSAIEYSIDDGRYVKEMTFKLTNMNHADKVKNLLYFVHKRHKDWEIELDYPINNFKIYNK